MQIKKFLCFHCTYTISYISVYSVLTGLTQLTPSMCRWYYYTVKNGGFQYSLQGEFSLHPVLSNTLKEFCYTLYIHGMYVNTLWELNIIKNANPQ